MWRSIGESDVKNFTTLQKSYFNSEMICLILSQHTLHVFCVCSSLQMSQPLLNIWFKEQCWSCFWSHANPQWEYLFLQNLYVTHICCSKWLITCTIDILHVCTCRSAWSTLSEPACAMTILGATELSLTGHPELGWEQHCEGLQSAVSSTISWIFSQNQANKNTFFGLLLLNAYQRLLN